MKLSHNFLPLLFSTLVACVPLAEAKESGHGGGHHSGGAHSTKNSGSHAGGSSSKGANHAAGTKAGTGHPSNHKAVGVARNKEGHIKRSEKAKDDFKHGHPCPSTGKSSGACPGYVVDHVKPLKRGGADAPSNMQWQSSAAAKQKDKTE